MISMRFAAAGIDKVVLIDGIMNPVKHQAIFNESVLPSIRKLG